MENQAYIRNMTADEAQAYLVAHSLPVQSRPAFYRYLERHKIPFTDLTPWSKKQTRRFSKEELDIFLDSIGITPNDLRGAEVHEQLRQLIENAHLREAEAEQTAQSAD